MDYHPKTEICEVKKMVEDTKNSFIGGLLAVATIAVPFIILL
jgi:hypothetical protein